MKEGFSRTYVVNNSMLYNWSVSMSVTALLFFVSQSDCSMNQNSENHEMDNAQDLESTGNNSLA